VTTINKCESPYDNIIVKEKLLQFIDNTRCLLYQTNRHIDNMNLRQLKFATTILRIVSAYTQFMVDGVRIYIDVEKRLNWLSPFLMENNFGDHFNVTRMTRKKSYQLRLKPLFQLSFEELTSLTTEEVTTFLLMHEQDGFI
jgi:hypothetical protein